MKADKRIKYIYDEGCFNKLTPESLYWLGFLYADGCISQSKFSKSYTITIALKLSDDWMIQKFHDFLKTNAPIYHGYSYSRGKRYGYSRMTIHNQKIAQSLLSLGMIPRKSLIIKFPDFLKNHPLKHHFIRGYFDGDGCVCEKSHKTKKWLHVTIVGTFDMMVNFNQIFKNELGILPRKLTKQGKVYSIHIGKKEFVRKLQDYLYKEATVFMPRKKRKFDGHTELKFGTSSKYKNICFCPRTNKWRVAFYDNNGKRREKTGFITEEVAFEFQQNL